MKTLLKLFTILLAAGYPCVALAENAGVHVPAAINAESTIAFFAAAFFVLLMIGDYGDRSARPARVAARAARRHESHRLAA